MQYGQTDQEVKCVTIWYSGISDMTKSRSEKIITTGDPDLGRADGLRSSQTNVI